MVNVIEAAKCNHLRNYYEVFFTARERISLVD